LYLYFLDTPRMLNLAYCHIYLYIHGAPSKARNFNVVYIYRV
jgi:hypothetical protein